MAGHVPTGATEAHRPPDFRRRITPPAAAPVATFSGLAKRASSRVLRAAALWVGGAVFLSASGAATGWWVRAWRDTAALSASAPASPPASSKREELEAPRVAPAEAAPVLPASCPLTPHDPPWLAVAPPEAPTPPQEPRSLTRRVDFWKTVWGERGDNQHFLVDDRRPWVVHAEVDCRDLFAATAAETAKADCGARLTEARRAAQKRLKRDAARPAVLKLFDGDRKLARSAHEHLIAIQGRKDALARATQRAAPSLGHTEGLFELQDVPRIYARAAIVESLWRPEALSRSGAAGAYQFMPKTGAQFLMVDEGVVDERLDPLRSAWAAAHYMSKMSRELKEWPLVLTAYNTGPARLKRVMKVRGTRDLGRIADAGTYGEFGFDGQNYFAQIAAIGQLTAAMEFEPAPVVGRALKLDKSMTLTELAACVEADAAAVARDNPALAAAVVEGKAAIPAGYVARVPSRDAPTLAVR